ncbi:MAG: DNA-3-methyladenine glycosylase I [Alphaproteobacteria bacterium]|nr:DNA-3-methyladenine glycosylase I [Alphaproteobacteria bacterium]
MTKQKTRCTWVGTGKPFYEKYHDEQWGVPVHDERLHFEMLVLEGAQAGLSWITILQRRAAYKKAFKNFDPKKVAKMTDAELNKLMKNEGIIRNRLKIYSARKNARVFLEIQKEFGSFDNYIWGFVSHKTIQNKWKTGKEIPIETKEAKALSKDLKKRGMSFVGPTIMYAHMQSIGMVNDHVTSCFRHKELR